MRIMRARSKTIGGSLKMAKLYFKYGAMGSSKTANALITKFNYEERGMRVLLIKPAMETRDGEDVIVSRIGLSAKCRPVLDSENIFDIYKNEIPPVDVIISDESQFFTPEQIDQLRRIVDECDIPVLCFGLRTDFLTKLFPGSMRLLEIADSLAEIKTICSCGSKATVNARISEDGRVVTAGDQVCLGGNDLYVAMCHRCWKKRIAENK